MWPNAKMENQRFYKCNETESDTLFLTWLSIKGAQASPCDGVSCPVENPCFVELVA